MHDIDIDIDIAAAKIARRKVVGARLAEARSARGLSRGAMAKIMEITPACICQLESGARGGGRDLWRKIANTLGVSMDWLLDGVGRPPAPAVQSPGATCQGGSIRAG